MSDYYYSDIIPELISDPTYDDQSFSEPDTSRVPPVVPATPNAQTAYVRPADPASSQTPLKHMVVLPTASEVNVNHQTSVAPSFSEEKTNNRSSVNNQPAPAPEISSDFTQAYPFDRIFKRTDKNKHLGGTVIGSLLIITLVFILSLIIYSSTSIGLFVEDWYKTGKLPSRSETNTEQSSNTPSSYLQTPSYREDKVNTEFKPGDAHIMIAETPDRELSIGEIYDKVNPATVMIASRDAVNRDDMKIGTGVIIDSSGFIVTNQHVVSEMDDYTVILSDSTIFVAELVAESSEYDLAILKIEASNLPVVTFGDSSLVKVGDPVCAIGNPLTLDLRATLTTGIISAKDRIVDLGNNNRMILLQTDAALNSGNSGGPLINRFGQVIGINSSKISGFISGAEGLGFAIPSTTIQRVVNTLLDGETMPPDVSFGLLVEAIGTEVEPGLFGLRVESVATGSAGEAAGIMAGDFILKADGQPLYLSNNLLMIRKQHVAGDKVPMLVYRDGLKIEITVELF